MSQPTFYTDGDSPRRDATRLIVLQKILGAILGGGGGGGGGGSGSVLQGTVDPTAAPSSPGSPAIYTNLTSGTIFSWNVTSQSWV